MKETPETQRVPLKSSVIAEDVSDSIASDGWRQYWDTLTPRSRLFEAQATEYVENLVALDVLNSDTTIFDFGCGFGFVANQLAAHAGQVYVWDRSSTMLRETARRTRSRQNVTIVDRPSALQSIHSEGIDLVLINSVIQYMHPEEFEGWMLELSMILAPNGAVLISDILPHEYRTLSDIVHVLRLSKRRGFLAQALIEGCKDVGAYATQRRSHALTRFGRDELLQIAAHCGMNVTILSANLTHFPNRTTAMFRRHDLASRLNATRSGRGSNPKCDRQQLSAEAHGE